MDFHYQSYYPTFDFSTKPENVKFILRSMDKVLPYTPANRDNPLVTRILDVLMGRDNYQEMEDLPSSLHYDYKLWRLNSHLDSSQDFAMSRLSRKTVTLVDGPAGSGKTMLAAIFGALSIQAGEK